MSNRSYSVAFSSGGQLRSHLNKISNDGHYSIAFFNNHITVYSVQSRLPIRSFYTLPNIKFNHIIDTFVSPVNNNLIYILSGTQGSPFFLSIINWYDNLKNPLVSTIQLTNEENLEFCKIVSFNSNKETVLNFLVKSKKHTYSLISYDLESFSLVNLETFTNVSLYAISLNFKNIVFTRKKNTLYYFTVFTFDDNNEFKLASYTVNYQYTKSVVLTLAISNDQSNPLIAFGTSNGPIILLFDLLSETPPQRLLKWHIDPPKSLAFNPDSNYLLSGGSEKVLVFWNILSEKQQFLPRLNGTIENILINSNIPTLIGLSLNIIDNDLQYLILGTTDLLSKLDINTPHVFSGMNTTNSSIIKNFAKDRNSFTKSNSENFTRFKHPYLLNFKIHPKSNHLYLPAGRHLQIYDSLHNTQVDNFAIAPAVQQYGKVGYENKIQDPMVVGMEFVNSSKTNEKDWLVTCDVEVRGEAEDLTGGSVERWETLRFWKFSGGKQENLTVSDSWSLQTKILRPHGQYPITSISAAPSSYFSGEGVITADSRGNVRLWRPNSQGIWSLRKFFSSGSDNTSENLNDNDNNIDDKNGTKRLNSIVNIANNEGTICSWSPDGSMIAVGRDGKVVLLDVNTFEAIHTISPSISASRFHKHASIANDDQDKENVVKSNVINNRARHVDLNLQDKHILSINFTSNGRLLVVETRSHLTIVDILKNNTIFGLLLGGEENAGFGGSFVKLTHRNKSDINDGISDLNDDTTDELLIVGKHFLKSQKVHSKVTLWNISDKTSEISCKWINDYAGAIIGAEWSETWQKWIMTDMESNLGEITYGKSTSRNNLLKSSTAKQNDNWIVSSLLDNARIMNRVSITKGEIKSTVNENADEFNDRVGLQGGVFDGILDSLEGVSANVLFERVMKVV